MSKKIEHLWSVLCEKSVTDVETNNISLTNVLESVQFQIQTAKDLKIEGDWSTTEKGVPINFELVTMWQRIADGEIKELVKVECLDPNGKILGSSDYQVEMGKLMDRFRFRIKFNGFRVTVPGIYRFLTKIRQGSTYRAVGVANLDIKISLSKISK